MIHINTNRWPYLEWRREEFTSQSIGWMALSVSIIAAGTGNSFAKVLGRTLSPITLLFVSEALLCAFVLFSFGLMPTLRRILAMPRQWFAPIIFVGLLNSTLAPMLLFRGLQQTTAVNASLFGNSEMVFMMILAVILLRERFTRVHALSICTMIAGMLTIALRGFTDGIEVRSGDGLILLSGLVYACGSITYRKFLHHCEPQVLLLGRSLVAMSCFFLLSPLFLQSPMSELEALPVSAYAVLIGFAFISKFLNVFGFYEALERLPLTSISLLSNLTVIASVVFAHWFLGEGIYGFHYIGGALIVLGSILLEFAGTHATQKHLEEHLRQRTHRA